MTTPTPPAAPEPIAPRKPVNRLARVSFIVAIVAFVLGCIPFVGFVTWIPAGVAAILGIVALTRPSLPKGFAVAGLIIGIIAFVAGPVTAIGSVIDTVSGSSNEAAAIASSAPAATPVAVDPATSDAATPSETPSETASADTTVKTKTYEGTGDKVLHVDYTAPVVVSFSCSGCSGNTSVTTDSGTDTLIVNTIGAYNGRHLLNTSDGSLLTKFVINADAHWKLKIVDALNATLQRVAIGMTIKGHGDDVIAVESGVTDSNVKNVGQGNFSLVSFGGSDSLPVNEIGSYKGNVVLDGPAVVQVTSDGTWMIKGNG